LAIDVAFSFGSHDVIRRLEAIADERGLPQAIRFDNELSTNVNSLGLIADVGASVDRPLRVSMAWQIRRRNSSDHDDTRSLRASLHRA
jgi:hypothetical protein